ncbi:MAG: hypothetical protein JSS66_05965 [Armatimonadetes bacterium]|nr:hypothetical protein [Armatimonadota bacterium]
MPAHLMLRDTIPARLHALVVTDRTMTEDDQVRKLFEQMSQNDTFTDSYGLTCALAQLGMSWWRDVVPMLDSEFVLQPGKCKHLAELVWNKMPPEPGKVRQALGAGTELTHCKKLYPDAVVIRDPSTRYTEEENAMLHFQLGSLYGLLSRGAQTNGLVLSP